MYQSCDVCIRYLQFNSYSIFQSACRIIVGDAVACVIIIDTIYDVASHYFQHYYRSHELRALFPFHLLLVFCPLVILDTHFPDWFQFECTLVLHSFVLKAIYPKYNSITSNRATNDLINPSKQTLLDTTTWNSDHWQGLSSQRLNCQSVMLIWLSSVEHRQLRRLWVSSTYEIRIMRSHFCVPCGYLITHNTFILTPKPPCVFVI